MEKLSYRPGDQFAPIPPAEAGLQTIVAEHFVQVLPDRGLLEGVQFDRTGENLYFVECQSHRVMKVNMATKEVSTVISVEDNENVRYPSAIKIAKDGRIWLPCCSEDYYRGGKIVSFNPDGSDLRIELENYVADDMVFDSKGGYYFTHFVGKVDDPNGGVYYVPAGTKRVFPVMENLAAPNGVALSPDEKTLWITETCGGRLLRMCLEYDDVCIPAYIPAFGTQAVYKTIGNLGPDSISTDADGNVYCAFFDQSRFMVFNRNGFPIGQILMPDRDKGMWPRSSHAVIRPGTQELYMCSSGDNGEGSAIFRCGAFAGANMNQSQYL